MPNDTTTLGLELPHPDNIAREDASRVRSALLKVDTALVDLMAAIAPQATEALAGRVRLATAAEAAAGTSTAAVATVKRVADMIAVLKVLVDLKAAAANAALTGVPTAPTAALGTNTDQIATMAALRAMRNDLVNGAGPALDQLNEFAAAINNDPNFSATILNLLAGKQPLDSDLTAIAALTTTAFGRSLLTQADASAARTALSALGSDGASGAGFYNSSDLTNPYIARKSDGSIARLWADTAASKSFGGNGYAKLPNGMIIQWGLAYPGWIYFPTVFPNYCAAVTTGYEFGPNGGLTFGVQISNRAVNAFYGYATFANGGAIGVGGDIISWMAIGW